MGNIHQKVTIDLDADVFQLLTFIQSKAIQEGKEQPSFSEIINKLLPELLKKIEGNKKFSNPFFFSLM